VFRHTQLRARDQASERAPRRQSAPRISVAWPLRPEQRQIVLAQLSRQARRVNPIVGFRIIALLIALLIVASDLHAESSLRGDSWVLLLACLHLGATVFATQRLPRARDDVTIMAIALDMLFCAVLLRLGHGWRGPFWLYVVSATFWPAYRFSLRGAFAAVATFDLLVVLVSIDELRQTFRDGYGGDFVVRLVMLFIVAGAVALTASALAQVRTLAAEAERNRIARDLHDGVGKTLGGIAMEAGSLASWIERDATEARRRARYVARISERAANEVRDVIRSLRLREASAPLFSEVRTITAEWSKVHPQKLNLQVNGADNEVPVLIRLEVMRMLTELLTNVEAHALANEVWVRVTLTTVGVTVAVRDDGVGFDSRLLDPWAGDGHFGLLGTRERASMLGGNFKVVSAPGAGTEVTVDLPLQPREERLPGLR
jgi:signal transduction histidine kinase